MDPGRKAAHWEKGDAGRTAILPPCQRYKPKISRQGGLMQTKRKRGAPKGNTNALKHGFYSRRFNDSEALELNDLKSGLIDEIALLRVLIRRVFEKVDEIDDDVENWARMLNTLSIASTRLASLLKTQKNLNDGEGSELSNALIQALSEVKDELGI
jgi:hypothetical protein